MMRQLQNSSERKITLLASLATTAIRLLTRVCSRRRRTDWQAQLASPGEKPPKSSIFLSARVLQFPLFLTSALSASEEGFSKDALFFSSGNMSVVSPFDTTTF